MEVADQWRREWAGTAEYGKVVEGGVTRRVARAMEVLHASGPGAKVRVMRAAYHTSAGPGLPASSYMMHASRRVFSSGFNFLEQSPSQPTRPLEISSTPLESSPDSHTDTENYKVTEPDDFEISEPSKWRGSSGGNTRMPSEESSSADNASIIDLDPKINHRDIFRKHSYDSENSDITQSGRNSRVSPLLDAPIALSTLKFKSLLNGSNDWNSRRKSYSFEDTCPATESIIHSNDTLAMESSTDSGICKSTEIVNDHVDDNTYLRQYDSKDRELNNEDDSFRNWLSKNRQNNSYYKGKLKSYKGQEKAIEDPSENNISLQSTGKVSITLPIKVETADGYHYQKNYMSEDGQRKIKKVEFCKTELHFTAETGTVNIIATDEKPPPTNDFRKRRSAFVPLHDMVEKPITLFGEKVTGYLDVNQRADSLKTLFESNESDENTAATKSILKNKIPKPKPYLLGENMIFGSEDVTKDDNPNDSSHIPTTVSLINRQLQSEKRCDNEIAASFLSNDKVSIKDDAFGTMNQGPSKCNKLKDETYGYSDVKSTKFVSIHEENNVNVVKNMRFIKRSPTPARIKARQLRVSDLTYFGIENQNADNDTLNNKQNALDDPADQDIFQSVRLIQQFSNSVCNSETEDAPEYINIPINTSYAPVPPPRIRSKFDDKPNQIDEIKVKPVIEEVKEIRNGDIVTTRRSKLRRQEEINVTSSRSLSEPRRSYKYLNSLEKPVRQPIQPTRYIRDQTIKENVDECKSPISKTVTHKEGEVSEDYMPIYANLNKSVESNIRGSISKSDSNARKTQREAHNKSDSTINRSRKLETPTSSLGRNPTDKVISKRAQKSSEEKDTVTMEKKNPTFKKNGSLQADKTDKSLQENHSLRNKNKNLLDAKRSNNSIETLQHSKHSVIKNNSNKAKQEHRSRSTQRHTDDVPIDFFIQDGSGHVKKQPIERKSVGESESNSDTKLRKTHLSNDKTNIRNETVKIIPRIENTTIEKSTTSREPKPRLSSKSRKKEYVINYDDKHGTVSSVLKLRSESNSPRRKKTTKEVVKEKFKENLKHKTADKAALLQPEDHQRDVNAVSAGRKRKSKVYVQRSCQVL